MPKPPQILNPKKVTLYMPANAIERGRAISNRSGSSLSQLVTELINSRADDSRKVRVHADFVAEEYAEIEREAAAAGQTVEDFIRTATYQLLDAQ